MTIDAPDLLIRGGTLIDATGSRSGDVAVSKGRIVEVEAVATSAQVIDATGCLVSTGLVDLHAHLGEPGDEAAETMAAAGQSAVRGGFTTVLAMPDTEPVADTAAVVEHVRGRSRDAACKVAVAGSVTVGGAGGQLAPLGELADAGVRVVTDCGRGIQSPRLMRRALEYAGPLGLTVAQTADCVDLSGDGQMHEGPWSGRLGLAGRPAQSEEIMVMRDISLAQLTGARLHFQTLSTAGACAIVGAARRAGVAVSAEVAAHHLLLADEDLASYDTTRKVFPPLRGLSDVSAVRSAVADGTIDTIVTDHTPHTTDRKERPFDMAEPGTTGLETALAVALTVGLQPEAVLRSLSWRPAELLGLGRPDERTLQPGSVADIAVIDPAHEWQVDARNMATRGTNCAFDGLTLTGAARATIVDGRLAHDMAQAA